MAMHDMAAARHARRFWRWWTGELKALLPQRLRRALERLRRRLEIRVENGELSLRAAEEDGTLSNLGSVPLLAKDPAAAGSALRGLLATHEGVYDEVVMRVEDARVLRRRARLPLAARGTLRETLGYDMDRQTPFSEDQVYYGVRELGIDREAGTVEVELEVVRRADVDPARAAVRGAGLELDRLEASAQGPNLLPRDEGAEARGPLRRVTLGLAAAAVVLAGLAFWLPLQDLRGELAAAKAEMARARADAAEVEAVRSELEMLRDREARLFARKAEELSALALLDEVSEAVPADAFATQFEYRNGELTLLGYAAKASEVLAQLENTPDLSQARYLSPVTQDQRMGRERFHIATRVAEERQ